MIKRSTYKAIAEAAKKSKRAALKSSIDKYLYLMSLTPVQVKKLTEKFLKQEGCAICERSLELNLPCPLTGDICWGMCIDEWASMVSAYRELKSEEGWAVDRDKQYYQFLAYAAQIYVKLLKAASKM